MPKYRSNKTTHHHQTLPDPTTAYHDLPEAYQRPTRPYQPLPDPTRAYQTLPAPTRPYQTLPDQTEKRFFWLWGRRGKRRSVGGDKGNGYDEGQICRTQRQCREHCWLQRFTVSCTYSTCADQHNRCRYVGRGNGTWKPCIISSRRSIFQVGSHTAEIRHIEP
jgi:hypothetical protein